MADNILQAPVKRSGVSDSMYNAELIITAFSAALKEHKCMTQVPMSMHAMADSHIFRLQNMAEMVIPGSSTMPGNEVLALDMPFEYIVPDSDGAGTNVKIAEPIEMSIDDVNAIKAWLKNCIPCGIDVPSFDYESLIDGIMEQIASLIAQMESVWNYKIGNFCPFLSMLSGMCMPDLIGILASILAYILKLTASIFLGGFSLMGFLLGILTGILKAVFSYIKAVIASVIAPLKCLINAITEIVSEIPTRESLAAELTKAEYELLFTALQSSETDPENAATYVGDAKKQSKEMLDLFNRALTNDIADMFAVVENGLSNALNGIDETINMLFGLIDYLDCEPTRSGIIDTNLFDQIQVAVQLVAMITALIDKVAGTNVIAELCRDNEGVSVVEQALMPILSSTAGLDAMLTTTDIADVVSDALGLDVAILVDDSGQDIGLILSSDDEAKPKFDMFSCSLKKTIKDYSLPAVRERATTELSDAINSPLIDAWKQGHSIDVIQAGGIAAPTYIPSEDDMRELIVAGKIPGFIYNPETIDEDIRRYISIASGLPKTLPSKRMSIEEYNVINAEEKQEIMFFDVIGTEESVTDSIIKMISTRRKESMLGSIGEMAGVDAAELNPAELIEIVERLSVEQGIIKEDKDSSYIISTELIEEGLLENSAILQCATTDSIINKLSI